MNQGPRHILCHVSVVYGCTALAGGQQAAAMMGVIGSAPQPAALPTGAVIPVGTPLSPLGHSATMPQPQGIVGYPPPPQQQAIVGPSVGQQP